MTLSCQASGIPQPMVFWIKADGRHVNGSELVLTNISRSEAGEYKCEASNECGNASETTRVDVQCKCKIYPLSVLNVLPYTSDNLYIHLFIVAKDK